MTITFRSDKGSPLTSDEVDENFRDLDGRVTGIETDTSLQGEGVSFIITIGAEITFYGTKGSNLGTADLSDPIDEAGLLYKLALG